jgi:DNA-binding FrmR family transcriptional regulator
MPHIEHPAIIKRLKRANGHLQKIIEMIEAGKPCIELAQQLQAVESAIENAKKTLIHDHITGCLEDSFKKAGPGGRAAMREFKSVARYL